MRAREILPLLAVVAALLTPGAAAEAPYEYRLVCVPGAFACVYAFSARVGDEACASDGSYRKDTRGAAVGVPPGGAASVEEERSCRRVSADDHERAEGWTVLVSVPGGEVAARSTEEADADGARCRTGAEAAPPRHDAAAIALGCPLARPLLLP